MPKDPKTKPRGFAAMDPERRRAISRLGGVRAHELGVAHKYDAKSGAEAGRKGGLARTARAET